MLKILFAVGSDGSNRMAQNARVNDFVQFLPALAVQVDDIKPVFPQVVRVLASCRPDSGTWMLAKSLIDAAAAADPESLLPGLILNSGARPLDNLSNSQLENTVRALDFLLPRVEAADLARMAVAAFTSEHYDERRYSIGLAMHWHLNAEAKNRAPEFSPGGALVACSKFLASFINFAFIEYSGVAIRKGVRRAENALCRRVGMLFDLLLGDRLALFAAMQDPSNLVFFRTRDATIEFIRGLTVDPDLLVYPEIPQPPEKEAWNDADTLAYFDSPAVRNLIVVRYQRLDNVDMWATEYGTTKVTWNWTMR